MKKLISLILILTFSSILCDSDNTTDVEIENYYNYAILLLKGMSDSFPLTKCADVLISQKSRLFPLLKDIFEKMDNQEELKAIIHKNAFILLSTPGLAENCNLLNAIPLYYIFSSPEKIDNIGKSIQENASKIFEQKQIMDQSEAPGKLIALGKIISIILKFTVH